MKPQPDPRAPPAKGVFSPNCPRSGRRSKDRWLSSKSPASVKTVPPAPGGTNTRLASSPSPKTAAAVACLRSQRPGPTLASGTSKRTPPGTTPLCPRPGFASRPPSRTTQTGLSLHRLHYCRDCLGKQQEIDRLKEENARLKDRLRYQERNAREAPSAPQPLRPNWPSSPTPWRTTKRKRRGQTGPCWQWPPPALLREITRTQPRARTPGVSGMWRWPPGQWFLAAHRA